MADKMKCTWDVVLDISQTCSTRASMTQLAEVALYDCEGKEIPPVAGSISNPGGKSPGHGREDPKFAMDKDVNTKWLDFQEQGGHQLVWTIKQPLTSIASYSWTAANDANVRDPRMWVLHGRESHGLNFFVVDEQYKTSGYTCGAGRPKRFNKNTFVTGNFDKMCGAKKTAKSACPATGCAGCFKREQRASPDQPATKLRPAARRPLLAAVCACRRRASAPGPEPGAAVAVRPS